MANKKKENDYKVVIGVPVADNDAMRALTAQAIGGSIIGANHAGIDVIDMVLRRSCDIVSNRTWLVNYALKVGATHLLFVDSDMLFPFDTIKKLLDHKKEIVGIKYKKRQFPVEWLYKPLPDEPESETELFKVAHVGTGLLLIDLSIFKDEKFGIIDDTGTKAPWFSFGRGAEGQLTMGEDIWFCNVARSAGYDIWVDPTLEIKHIGEYLY